MRMLKIPISKHVPDHEKPLFLHPPFEHVIEYERSKTRSETRLEINVFFVILRDRVLACFWARNLVSLRKRGVQKVLAWAGLAGWAGWLANFAKNF